MIKKTNTNKVYNIKIYNYLWYLVVKNEYRIFLYIQEKLKW